MYKNLLKSGNVVKHNEARIIDSNTLVAERLAYLSEALTEASSDDDEFYNDFTAGLNALQVEQLLGDEEQYADMEGYSDMDGSDDMEAPVRPAPEFDMQAFIQMKQDAENEAEAILNAAREEADRIVGEAKQSALSIMDEARVTGHGEGYTAGYDEGLQKAKELEDRCIQREEELEIAFNKKVEELEPLFVDKLTDIYEHIFLTDLSDRKELVMILLINAMRNIEGGRSFLVHVSKDDYEFVSARKDELMQGLPGTSVLEVIEDMTLKKSQSFIETDSGIFDCSLGTELALLKKELTLLSFK